MKVPFFSALRLYRVRPRRLVRTLWPTVPFCSTLTTRLPAPPVAGGDRSRRRRRGSSARSGASASVPDRGTGIRPPGLPGARSSARRLSAATAARVSRISVRGRWIGCGSMPPPRVEVRLFPVYGRGARLVRSEPNRASPLPAHRFDPAELGDVLAQRRRRRRRQEAGRQRRLDDAVLGGGHPVGAGAAAGGDRRGPAVALPEQAGVVVEAVAARHPVADRLEVGGAALGLVVVVDAEAAVEQAEARARPRLARGLGDPGLEPAHRAGALAGEDDPLRARRG